MKTWRACHPMFLDVKSLEDLQQRINYALRNGPNLKNFSLVTILSDYGKKLAWDAFHDLPKNIEGFISIDTLAELPLTNNGTIIWAGFNKNQGYRSLEIQQDPSEGISVIVRKTQSLEELCYKNFALM